MKFSQIIFALCCVVAAPTLADKADDKSADSFAADFRKALDDGKTDTADALAKARLRKVPADDAAALAKAFDDICAAYEAAGIFGCEAAQKWWDRSAREVVRTGDSKWIFLGRYADFLEKYALASIEDVDGLRAERDRVVGVSPKLRFQIVLDGMSAGDTDEGYATVLTNALAIAGTNVWMRLKVYDRALGKDDKALPSGRAAFIRDVVLRDPAVIGGKGRLGPYLIAYAKCAYGDFMATEKFLRSFESVDARAVRGALRELWSIAGQRYYHDFDPALAKKILVLLRLELCEFEANPPPWPNWQWDANLNALRRKVVEAALNADEPAVAEETLVAIEKEKKPDLAYVGFKRAELAYRAKRYADVVNILRPLADDKALDGRWDFPAEILVRSFVGLGDLENAAMYMEKKLVFFPGWGQRNYYKPRLEALKARAAEARKKREAP